MDPADPVLADFNLTGLSRGGQQVQKSRDTYVKAVGTLVELASLQVSARLGGVTEGRSDDHEISSVLTALAISMVSTTSSRADVVELLRRGGVLRDKSLTMGSSCLLDFPLAWLPSSGLWTPRFRIARFCAACYHPRRHVFVRLPPHTTTSGLYVSRACTHTRHHIPTPYMLHPPRLFTYTHAASALLITHAVSPPLNSHVRRCDAV